MATRLSKLVALCTFVTLLVGRAASAQSPSLAGVYLCSGAGPIGAAYEGLVEIAEYEDTYHLQWIFPDEGRIVVGIGVRNNDVLAVMYFGQDPGLVTYRIEDERLVGTWTTLGAAGHVFTETLTKTDLRILPAPPATAPEGPAPQPPAGRPIRVMPAVGTSR